MDVETTFSRVPGRIVLLCALALSACLLAPSVEAQSSGSEGTTASKPLPRLKIHEPRFDWGAVYQGEIVVHDFKVENIGSAPLRIVDVKPGCSCSIAKQDWKRKLAPGESTKISIAVDTGKLKEPKKYNKKATITTSDPRNVKAKVELSGIVKRVLDFEPRKLVYTETAGRPISGEFEIFAPEEDVSVKLLELKPRMITIDELTELETNRRWKVKFSMRALEKPGTRSDKMYASVEADGTKKLNVPVVVSMKWVDRIQISTRNLTFKRTETDTLLTGSESIEKAITVSSEISGAKFSVTQVELLDANPDIVSTEIVEVVPNSKYQVLVKVRKWLPERFLKGAIRIHTNDPNSRPYDVKLFVRYDVSKKTAGR